jgi:hypothetical protein
VVEVAADPLCCPTTGPSIGGGSAVVVELENVGIDGEDPLQGGPELEQRRSIVPDVGQHIEAKGAVGNEEREESDSAPLVSQDLRIIRAGE